MQAEWQATLRKADKTLDPYRLELLISTNAPQSSEDFTDT